MSDTIKKDTSYLSKTLFIKGLQCHKALYLQKYHPELKDDVSDAKEALFSKGTDVGVFAQQLFPKGVEIPYEDQTLSDQIKQTKAEIKKGTATIYEAAFSYKRAFCKVDILHKSKKGWEIYEVKSSTGMKDVYYDDVAFQYYVLKNTGLSVSKASLVHLNNQYVKDGEIEANKLFTIQNLTKNAKKMKSDISRELKKQRKMLKGDIPDIDIGEYCKNPYDCDFAGHCRSHIPENSIGNMKDLMAPFRSKDYYLWKMNGSYSIKAVLPALIPELSYDGMEISNGGMAMDAYSTMCQTEDPGKLKRIRKALLEYCGLDTLGMVRIVDL